MKIQTSLDWNDAHTSLLRQVSGVGYNPDLFRMLSNIHNMVEELSKQEVKTRRINKPEYNKKMVDDINKAIDHLEKLILVAQLMR